MAVQDSKSKLKAGIFLASISGLSILGGFGYALAVSKKQDPKMFLQGFHSTKHIPEAGTTLAVRALGWGSFYAIAGVGFISYSIWKLSGATTLQEFRTKMGNIFPRVPKNDPPQGRTEFRNLTDLLQYIIDEDDLKKAAGDTATTRDVTKLSTE